MKSPVVRWYIIRIVFTFRVSAYALQMPADGLSGDGAGREIGAAAVAASREPPEPPEPPRIEPKKALREACAASHSHRESWRVSRQEEDVEQS